ncbi:hypothetical protein BDQ17DRAFT_1233460, partial [Cyathus striatus]
EDAEKIVKNHIKLLHQYNEAKDATQVCPRVSFGTIPHLYNLQILIGRAILTETTIRKIHEDLGLTADD